MFYREFKPHPALAQCIDAYWTVSYNEAGIMPRRIMPDGCVDIIINLGTDYYTEGGISLMKNEQAYLVGTMTRYKDTLTVPGTRLVGIRFKPGGFSFFYRFDSLKEFTNTTIEFDKKLVPEVWSPGEDLTARLDRFLLKRMTDPGHRLFPVVEEALGGFHPYC